MKGAAMRTTLIRSLARRRGLASEQPEIRYDPRKQVTIVRVGHRWVPSYRSDVLAVTKKRNVETGEDQEST
jgi:hypothetical protein